MSESREPISHDESVPSDCRIDASSDCDALRVAFVDQRRELERMAAELRDREARTRQIINTANDAFVSTDIGCRVTEWNSTAEQLFGWSAHQTVGRRLDEFIYPRDRHRDPGNPLSAILSCCGDDNRGEMLARRADGAELPVEVSISVMADEDHFIFNAFIHDISERHKLQQQLVQAQKLESIGQLAAGIAHEINTPTQYVGDNLAFMSESFEGLLKVLRGYESLGEAVEKGGDPAEALGRVRRLIKSLDMDFILAELPEALRQARDGVGRVAQIVRSMKDFSHPGGDLPSSIDLNRSIESTVTVCRSEWKYVAEVTLDLDTQLPMVPCYPGELNQVLLNLIVNSAQALGEAGHDQGRLGVIKISTRRVGQQVEIRVSDNGPGIAPEHLPRVFDPFFTTKSVGKGTGQGLAIAHSVVVVKHGGSIRAESVKGRGATFVILLPLKRETSAGAWPIQDAA